MKKLSSFFSSTVGHALAGLVITALLTGLSYFLHNVSGVFAVGSAAATIVNLAVDILDHSVPNLPK